MLEWLTVDTVVIRSCWGRGCGIICCCAAMPSCHREAGIRLQSPSSRPSNPRARQGGWLGEILNLQWCTIHPVWVPIRYWSNNHPFSNMNGWPVSWSFSMWLTGYKTWVVLTTLILSVSSESNCLSWLPLKWRKTVLYWVLNTAHSSSYMAVFVYIGCIVLTCAAGCCNGLYEFGFQDWRSSEANSRCD